MPLRRLTRCGNVGVAAIHAVDLQRRDEPMRGEPTAVRGSRCYNPCGCWVRLPAGTRLGPLAIPGTQEPS